MHRNDRYRFQRAGVVARVIARDRRVHTRSDPTLRALVTLSECHPIQPIMNRQKPPKARGEENKQQTTERERDVRARVFVVVVVIVVASPLLIIRSIVFLSIRPRPVVARPVPSRARSVRVTSARSRTFEETTRPRARRTVGPECRRAPSQPERLGRPGGRD
jgi:hypothetical protein